MLSRSGNDRGAKAGSAAGEATPDSTPVYQSFFEGNPVYHQVGENQTACGYDIPIYRKGLEGDTVIEGLLYHKLSCETRYDKRVQFWVRESDGHDKVWVRLPWDTAGREILAVDMNLGKGETFVMYVESETLTMTDTTWDTIGNSNEMIISCKDTIVYKEICYVVDSVYHLEHPGGVLKHIRLKPQDYNGYTKALEETWGRGKECDWRSRHLEFIEGLGSNLGFVYHRLGVSYNDSLWGCMYPWRGHDGPTDYIVCMERDSGVYYVHPNAECMDCDTRIFDWKLDEPTDPRDPPGIANERVRSLSRHLRVSPNPASETATLQWDAAVAVRESVSSCRIEIHTLQGVRLRSCETDSWPYTLRVSDLKAGTYLLRVVPSEGAWQATVRLTKR
ncbi:MAG: T9SS type A sorting domain-containing protein [Bacteroidales bacterium]|nr:T9SS type A sorting domain-containing protein [Bacteroidales bacterium]